MKHFITTAMSLAALALLGACSSEDATSVSNQTQEETAISFDAYLGQSVTRGTIADGTTISSDGVGVFAMYTKDGKYGQGNYTNFEANFMSNQKVHGPEGTNARWQYSPLRYWPTSATDYVSFLAYGPYQETAPQLYDVSSGTPAETGNLTWIKHEVNADPAQQVDLIRGRINTTNMQLRRNSNGTIYKSADNSSAFTGGTSTSIGSIYPDVNLKMIHATSRVAVVVSAPALLDEGNYIYTAGQTGTVKSNTTITVNKVMLLGDNTSANEDKPTGAFTPSAYLNLGGRIVGTAGNYTPDFWADKATEGKLAFTLDKFADGTYDETNLRNTAAGKVMWSPTTTENSLIQGTMTNGNPNNIEVNDVGTRNSDYLFVIPQDFTSDPLYCYIEYTVKYDQGTAGSVATDGVTYRAYGKVEKNMTAGSAYVIHINIGSANGGISSLNAITFHVSVDAWANEQKADVQI